VGLCRVVSREVLLWMQTFNEDILLFYSNVLYFCKWYSIPLILYKSNFNLHYKNCDSLGIFQMYFQSFILRKYFNQ